MFTLFLYEDVQKWMQLGR